MATALEGAKVVSALSPALFDQSKITYEKVDLSPLGKFENGKLAFILRNVLTEEECAKLISQSEAYQYLPAMINMGDGCDMLAPGLRDGERVTIDDAEFVQILSDRIAEYLPKQFGGVETEPWTFLAINERLRFLKHNGKFEPHKIISRDVGYIRVPGREVALITLQIYLNGGFVGGETTFLDVTQMVQIPVVPEPGMVLVFQHGILHKVSLVTSGTKYAVRSDVFYKAPEPKMAEPKPKAAWFQFWKK